MIDKKIFEFMLGKLNATGINTQGIKFKGNYVFVRVNDIMYLQEASTYNQYDTKDVYFVAMAETVSQPTDYVEENNRTGWVKQYTFQFDVRDKDKVLEALQEVYLYLKANNVQSIVDDTTYKFVMKPTRPAFIGTTAQGAGTVFAFYSMNLLAETIETGFYDNEVTHKMSVKSGTLQAIIKDRITVGSATAMNPSNDLTVEGNTTNKPISRGTSLQFVINYDDTTFQRTLRKVIEGKSSRETIFTYEKKMPNETAETWNFRITGGNCVYKSGVLLQLAFNGVEE